MDYPLSTLTFLCNVTISNVIEETILKKQKDGEGDGINLS